MPGRRTFIKSGAAAMAAAWFSSSTRGVQLPREAEAVREDTQIPAWQPGVLEIHQIDTGRGNAALILGPDATSLLVDAGESHGDEKAMSPARPDGSRRAGEWIARYVSRQLDRAGRSDLDLMLLTHFHGDHVGEVATSSPQSTQGPYRLTGAGYVAETIRVRELIDRGWPDYGYPAPPQDPAALNYIALAKSMAERGTSVRRAQAGSRTQLALRHDAARYPHFSARVLSVNGEVWTGSGEDARPLFPHRSTFRRCSAFGEYVLCLTPAAVRRFPLLLRRRSHRRYRLRPFPLA